MTVARVLSAPVSGSELWPEGGQRATIRIPAGRLVRDVQPSGGGWRFEFESYGRWYPAFSHAEPQVGGDDTGSEGNAMTTSGYTHCACPSCFETVVSSDMGKPEMCHDCDEAGCDGVGAVCQVEGAYDDADDGCEVCDSGKPTTYNPTTKGYDCEECRQTIVQHDDCGTAFYSLDGAVCDVCGEGGES